MTVQNNFQDAHAAVIQLVERFEKGLSHYLSPSYQEQEARKDFLDKFFTALGWDVNHETQVNPYEQEVKIEKSVTTGVAKRRADYSFSLAPNFTRRPRFFVEAKRPQQDIATPDNYFQAIRYSWSHQLPLVVLTDFNSFHIIDSRYRPDIKTSLARQLAVYHFRDYCDPDVFAKIYWLFSREATSIDAIGKYADTLEKPTVSGKQLGLFAGGYQNIDDAFLGQLDQYREELARSFKRHNPELSSEQLTEVVQRLLDRLVFTRFLEDKLIEPEPIISRLGTKTSAWKQFVRECDRLDKLYNGVVYKYHAILDSPKFKVDDTAFLAICDELTEANSPYDFNAIPVEILGRIYERFLGKVVVATAKRATVEEKPDVRKAGGVFYTPDYIVTHMVEQALGPKVKGKSPDDILSVRTIDTSCGSGSFLIGVYEYILTELARTYAANPKLARKKDVVMREGIVHLSIHKKREVLINCIFGIDIDAQAVEVTQLSLYLKLLEDETTDSAHTQQLELAAALLPSLNQNIIVGNSLISPIDDANADDMFTIEKYDALRAVDLHRTFPQVFRKGGFDLVIGNPPYIKESTNREAFDNIHDSPYYQGKMDIWYMFACRALDILKKDQGTLAFIATNNWVTNAGARRLREKVTNEARIEQLIDFGDYKVFKDAGIQTMILVAKRANAPDSYSFDYRRLDRVKPKLVDALALLKREPSAHSVLLNPIFDRRRMPSAPMTFSGSEIESLLRKIEEAKNFALDERTEIAHGIDVLQDVVNSKAAAKLRGAAKVGDGVFVLTDQERNDLNLTGREADLLRPYYTTKELGRYVGNSKNSLWIIYTTSKFKEAGAMMPFPKLKSHLNKFAPILTSVNKPYGLHRARDENFFTGEKIFAQRKSVSPTFTYTDFDCYVSRMFISIKSNRIDLKYLTALLNSKVVKYWLKNKGKMQGQNFQLDNEPLLALPLVSPPNDVQQRVAKLVDLILQATQKLNNSVLDSERDRYQRLIDQTDAKIQEAIYKVYNLDESDINVVNA